MIGFIIQVKHIGGRQIRDEIIIQGNPACRKRAKIEIIALAHVNAVQADLESLPGPVDKAGSAVIRPAQKILAFLKR